MKLSEVRGERTFDVIADIVEPISNIAADKEAAELFTRKQLPEGMTKEAFVMKRLKKSMPVLLKNHKEDLIVILAAIEGVAPEKYGKELNLVKLTRDVTELLNDDAFKALFF